MSVIDQIISITTYKFCSCVQNVVEIEASMDDLYF